MIKDYDSFIAEFGKRVTQAREAKGMTQTHLSRVLCTNGTTVIRYERGEQLPRMDKLCELCDALNVSADWIMERFEK